MQWSDYEILSHNSKSRSFPDQFEYVVHIRKSEWIRMEPSEKRAKFKKSCVHVIHDLGDTSYPVSKFDAKELHDMFDLYQARFCHGK